MGAPRRWPPSERRHLEASVEGGAQSALPETMCAHTTGRRERWSRLRTSSHGRSPSALVVGARLDPRPVALVSLESLLSLVPAGVHKPPAVPLMSVAPVLPGAAPNTTLPCIIPGLPVQDVAHLPRPRPLSGPCDGENASSNQRCERMSTESVTVSKGASTNSSAWGASSPLTESRASRIRLRAVLSETPKSQRSCAQGGPAPTPAGGSEGNWAIVPPRL